MAATPDGALIINAAPTGNELVEMWRGNMRVAYPVSSIQSDYLASTVSGVTPGGALICQGSPTGEEVITGWVNGNSQVAYRLRDINGDPSPVVGKFTTPDGVPIVNIEPTGNELIEAWSGNTPVAFSKANMFNPQPPPVVVPTPLHRADFGSMSESTGATIASIPNTGSSDVAFTTVSGREPIVGTIYGKKTMLTTTGSAINLPALIPYATSYSILVAHQPPSGAASGGNRDLIYQWDGAIDLLFASNAIRHNGTGVPANGFNFTSDTVAAFNVIVITYDLVSGTGKAFRNGALIASGPLPARSGTLVSGIINNVSNALGNNGVAADWLDLQIWSTTLTDAEAIQASKNARDAYSATYGRFVPPTAQKAYAFWTDSMSVTPSVAEGVNQQLGLLYTPNAFVYNGGFIGNTSTQVRTRFETAGNQVYRQLTNVFWCMRNNFSVGINVATGIADLQAMIAALDDPSRFLVLLTCRTVPEMSAGPGNASYDAMTASRAAQIAAFPNNYLDVETIVLAHNSDQQHPDATGAQLIAAEIKAWLVGKGW